MVDRLTPGQLEALYVLLQGMVRREDEENDAALSDAPPQRRFSFIGIMDAEPDLAERSAQILRSELGNPPA